MPRFAIVVGEASGDQLGRGLIEAIRARCPEAEFVGVTGPEMRAAGCESWHDYQQLAIMGLVEVLRHIPGLRRLMKDLQARLRAEPPDVLIGIDAPDFNLRLEAFARKQGIPTVHYVCPSVWAWRQSRVKTIRRSCDLVLCLLPFEASFLADHSVAALFVGHPMADEIAPDPASGALRAELGLGQGELLALLPGSRAGEVHYLAPVFLRTVTWLRQHKPELNYVVAAANAELAATVQEQIEASGLAEYVTVRTGETRAVIGAADAVLLSSGTATLETLLVQRPMVVAYIMNGLTAWLARRLVKIEYAALPNLLAGRQLVPEFLQEAATPEALGQAVLDTFAREDERAAMLREFAQLGSKLRQSASERAADGVLALLAEQGSRYK